MNGLGDTLMDAYAAEERRARTRVRDPHRTIVAIRRRRRVRAAGTGTAAAVGVAAVGVAWWLAPGGRSAEPAKPAPSNGCEIWPYVPPHPAALGDAPIKFRAYIDLRRDAADPKVVVVQTNGTASRLEPNDAGDYVYVLDGHEYLVVWSDYPQLLKDRPSVGDYGEYGGGGDVWDGVSPFVRDYAWTMVIPTEVPEGINTEALSSTLRIAMGMGGMGYVHDAVPAGAVADSVVTTTTGATEVSRLKDGDPGPSLEDRDDVASVGLRVSQLPGGGTFTIVANYDPSRIPAPVCVDDRPGLTTFTSSPVPSPAVPAAPQGSPSPEPSVSPTAPPIFGSSPSPTPAPSQG